MTRQPEESTGGQRRPLVVLAGNIAAGKTTATPLLAAALGASSCLESVADNPFLERYYADMGLDVPPQHVLPGRSRTPTRRGGISRTARRP